MKDKTKHPGVAIEKRGRGAYRLRWDVGGIKASKTLHCGRDEAERKAIELSENIQEGRTPDPNATFARLEKTLENYFYPVRSQAYRRNIKKALEQAREYLPARLKHIKPMDIETVMADMIKAGLSASTVNGWYRNCNAAFTVALKYQLIEKNPFKKVRQLKVELRPVREITEGEEDKLLNACTSARDKLMVVFALYGSMRVGEIGRFNLREDIKEDYTLIVRATKTGTWRVVSLPDRYLEELRKYNTVRKRKYDPVPFYGNGNSVSGRLSRLIKKAGIKARPHDLRQTCATRLARKGVNAWRLKEYMGHSSINTTERYYISSMDPDNREKIWQ